MSFNFNVKGITPQETTSTGGGGSSTPQNPLALPSKTAGLCMWLDGEINSRAGVRDTSLHGMQNLVYAPLVLKDSTVGCIEALIGTPTFGEKSCKLGATCYYPQYATNEMTIEFCISYTANTEALQRVIQATSTGGYSLHLNNKGNENLEVVQFGVFDKSMTAQGKNLHVYHNKAAGEKIYFAVTTKIDTANSTKMYLNGEEVEPIVELDNAGSLGTKACNVGLGGTAVTTGTNGNFQASLLNYYSFRLWSRRLSPAEIKANYQADYKRFGA